MVESRFTRDPNGTVTQQRLSEWLDLSESDWEYHLEQWTHPHRSTKAFEEFISRPAQSSRTVIDICCGAGGPTSYLARQFPGVVFTGLDIAPELIGRASRQATASGLTNVGFETDDCFNLSSRSGIDGVIMIQSLGWLADWREPLRQMFEKLSPRWVALSSLFYPGDISCRVEVTEHKRNRQSFYNVYAVPQIAAFAETHGMRLAHFQKFEIDIDLPKPPSPDFLGTYTIKTEDASRLQISGPLLLNWGFILLERKA